ncbi:MAG: cell division protein ZipA C-terminal FtsZ-binding domain-containing protein [Cycloclasticus sp.]
MEENSLRLVLLGLGVFILVGIYFYDVWQKKYRLKLAERDEGQSEEKIEPVFAMEVAAQASFENEPVIAPVEKVTEPVEIDVKPVEVATEEIVEVEAEPVEEVPVAQQALVVQLLVVAKSGSVMAGSELLAAFSELELEFGDMGVFHRYQSLDGADKAECFHVANMLEPGTFPVDSMAEFSSTGLVLFFQSSDVVGSEQVFEDMLTAARALAELFDASLIDAEMNELIDEKIAEIRSRLQGLSGL